MYEIGNELLSTRPGEPDVLWMFLMHAAAMGGAAFVHPSRTLAATGESAAAAAGAAPETFSPPELLARQAARAAGEPRRIRQRLRRGGPRMQSGSGTDYAAMYRDRRNWGRWGDGDQVGAINLITPEKRAAAAGLVRTGRTVSLSRVFEPPQHFIQKSSLGPGGGFVMDYLGFIYHGSTITHVDALCHIWDDDGMWQGHDPDVEITTQGAQFGDITHWSGGIITKGVLIDVPRHRGEPHVGIDEPVRGDELEAIASAQGVSVEAGDALLVHSGWTAYMASGDDGSRGRPGLHPSCAEFIRDHDVALLGWDLMDARADSDLPWPVHGVLFNFGVALLDNALLEPVAAACAEEARWEFMFQALPLRVARGTGSPVNPIAMF